MHNIMQPGSKSVLDYILAVMLVLNLKTKISGIEGVRP